jgi:hypothetical protein
MPEASSSPILLRATMPQVQSPDTGEGQDAGGLECTCHAVRRAGKQGRHAEARPGEPG